MLMFASAFRAFTFDDEGYGVGEESLRQLDTWDMDVFHAEGSLARFTIEVDVSIVVVAFSLFLAEFIVEDALPVLEGMYHVVFQEESERPKMLDLSIDTIFLSSLLRLCGVSASAKAFITRMRLAVGLMPLPSSLLIIS